MSDAEARTVTRPQVLRRLLNLYHEPRYLEVGVFAGRTFHRVPAARKVAVDPEFRFDHHERARAHPEATYHQVTSDEYFNVLASPEDLFDVIYLDGLHEFGQTLRDLLNALEHLQPRGVIVIDDTRPHTSLASIPDRARFFEERSALGVEDQAWMGDVYKVVHFVQAFCPYLSYRTISNNHGQTVVWRQQRNEAPLSTIEAIAAMGFEEFARSQDVLRLKRFGWIRHAVRRDLGL
ncbi:MAG TPA: class I SAM-dependent methyltransferase [Nocardioides sp.]|uniref:class I SAM-dependent methyltransferase n=1 Tax=Nocardioides sp. TaxID=35761 RepID=UPI002B732171|nr:class I SAM-dependent methyltransferase [Nocardioides sp.]HQR27105.1 class I SAM-dependent methyltransferase [Nocardioides sp.]